MKKKVYLIFSLIVIICSFVIIKQLLSEKDGNWYKKDKMFDVLEDFYVCETGNKFYVFGGYDKYYNKYNEKLITDKVSIYDIKKDKWTKGKNMVIGGRIDFGGIENNGKIYMVGGFNGENYIKSTIMYDTKEEDWTLLSGMNNARAVYETTLVDGNIYAIGGMGENGKYRNEMERYNISLNKWVELEPMIKGRKGFEFIMSKNKFYVIGGLIYEDEDIVNTNSIEVYSIETGKWEELAPMNVKRSGFEAEFYDNKIYVFGGSTDKSFFGTDSVEVYDIEKNSWELINPMKTERKDFETVLYESDVYIMGGVSNEDRLKSVEKYNLEKEEVNKIDSMNYKRENLCSLDVNGVIYVLGGIKSDGFITDFFTNDKVVESYKIEK